MGESDEVEAADLHRAYRHQLEALLDRTLTDDTPCVSLIAFGC